MVPPGADVTISQTGVVSADGAPIDRIALFELQGNIVRIGPQLYAAGPGRHGDADRGRRVDRPARDGERHAARVDGAR